VRALTARFGPALFLVAYFFWFAGGGLWARFTGDDLMNLNFHLTPSFARLLLSNLTYWTTAYRPMGGILYVAIYRLAGFHSMPFRVVCFGLLLLNLGLLFRVCLRLTGRREVALLATLLVSYHAWMVNLYYSTGTVYELLCFAFYWAAFDYYLGVRQAGKTLRPGQLAVFLALYICALNSKELAVTLPLCVLCYEWIWHRTYRAGPGAPAVRERDRTYRAGPGGHPVRERYRTYKAGPGGHPVGERDQTYRAPAARELDQAHRAGPGGHPVRERYAAVALSALVTLPYVVGKLTGPDSLAANPLYRPAISPARYLHTFHLYLNVLFYQDHFFRDANTILLVAAMLALAIWRHSRPLLFAWCFSLFSVLPFIFVPHYSGFFLYLPMAGWALYAATAIEMLRGRFAKAVPPAVVFLTVALVLGPLHARESRKTMQVFTSADLPTTETIAQLRRVQPSVPKGAHLFFESDPFPPKTFSLVFLVRLFYDDLTVEVARAKDGDAADSRHFDAVFRWDDGNLVKVEPPL